MKNRPNPFSKVRDLIGKRRQQGDPLGSDGTGAGENYGDYAPNYVYDDSLKDALGATMKANNLSFPEDPNDESFNDLLKQARDIDRQLATNIQDTRIDMAEGRNNPLLQGEQLRAKRAAGGRELLERVFYVENSSGHPTINKGLVAGLLLAGVASLFFLLGTPVDTSEAATIGDGTTVTAADGTTVTTYPDRVVELSADGIETTTYPDKRIKIVDLKTGVTTVRYPDKVEIITQKDGSSIKTLADGTVLRYDSTGALAVNLPPGQIDSALNDPGLIQTPNTVRETSTSPTIGGPGSDQTGENGDAANTVADGTASSDGVTGIKPPPDGSEFDGAAGTGFDGTGENNFDSGGSTVASPDGSATNNAVTGPITAAEDPYTYTPDEPVSTVQSSPVQSSSVPDPFAGGGAAPGSAADPYAIEPTSTGQDQPTTVVTLSQPQTDNAGANGAVSVLPSPGGTSSPAISTPPTVTIRRASPLPPPTASDLAAGGQNAGASVFSGGTTSATRGATGTRGGNAPGAAASASGPMTATYSSGVDHSTPGGSGAPKASVIARQPFTAAPNVLKRGVQEGAVNNGQTGGSVIFRRKISESGVSGQGTSTPAAPAQGVSSLDTASPPNTSTEQFASAAATDTTGMMASAQGAGGGSNAQNGQGASGGQGVRGPSAQAPAPGTAASPYKPGQYLRATLETGMVLPADGGAGASKDLVVFARTADGTLWLGTPSISPTRRMTLSFTRAQLRDGSTISLDAQAYDNDATPGIRAEFKPEAPSLVDDLIRSTISGVRDYAEAKIQATRTTTGIGGSTVVERQVPTIFESVAASAAGVFQLPPTQATFINTARVKKGQSFVIVITLPLQNSLE